MARPRKFDEEQVLAAVLEQFWDGGYADTSLEDLMRTSGLGKGSLYAAFGDKHQLFLRAIRSYDDGLEAALRAHLAKAPRAVDGLRSYLRAPAVDRTGAAARRGCFLANSTTELAAQDPELLAEARRTYDATTARLREAVVRAQAQGDVPASVDAQVLARSLLAAQQGITFMGRSGLEVTAMRSIARHLARELLPDRNEGSGRASRT